MYGGIFICVYICTFFPLPEAIEETLGEMGQMFVNDIKEMANVMDVTD